MRLAPIPAILAVLAALAPTAPAAQQAEEEAGPGGLSIELNAARDGTGGCTLSFVITNGGAEAVEKAVFETVLFDTGGQVDRLTLFDFGALPAGRPRVRQFTLPDTSCGGIGRILVNGVSTCEAARDDACSAGLTLSTRTDIEVVG